MVRKHVQELIDSAVVIGTTGHSVLFFRHINKRSVEIPVEYLEGVTKKYQVINDDEWELAKNKNIPFFRHPVGWCNGCEWYEMISDRLCEIDPGAWLIRGSTDPKKDRKIKRILAEAQRDCLSRAVEFGKDCWKYS